MLRRQMFTQKKEMDPFSIKNQVSKHEQQAGALLYRKTKLYLSNPIKLKIIN